MAVSEWVNSSHANAFALTCLRGVEMEHCRETG